MGLSIRYGRDIPDFKGKGSRPYWYATELMEGFCKRHGHIRCRDLLGLDLRHPEDHLKYSERNLWGTRCSGLITSAVELAHELLAKAKPV